MKLLVISHACILPIHQSFYADVMDQTGWSVTLVTPSRWSTQYGALDASRRWPEFSGKIVRINTMLTGDIPKHLYKSLFRNILVEENPDAIYVHHEPYGFATAQIYLANRLTGNRPIGFYAAQNIEKKYPLPIRLIEQSVFRNSNFAFPVTQSALDVLRSKGYTKAAQVLPLSLDENIYHPDPGWAQQKRQDLGFSADRVLIGYMGRLVEEKGLGTLLSALSQLGDMPWELLFVGSGPYEQDLRQQVKLLPADKQDHVHFLGYAPHEEAPKWLGLFDILVLPSRTQPNWKEQFGRVLVEAMACDTPVIGSNSGEIPNIISLTKGGIVFPEGDRNALAAALDQLGRSRENRSAFSAKGRESVARYYDQRQLAMTFASTIEGALSETL